MESIAHYLVWVDCRVWDRNEREKGIKELRRGRKYNLKNSIELGFIPVRPGEGAEE